MVKILRKFGYYIGDENGRNNFKANILDTILFTTYFIISLINSLKVNPSVFVIILNIISMRRIIIKNHLEQYRIVSKSIEDERYLSANITKVHFLKISFEVSSLIFLIFFIFWNLYYDNVYSMVVFLMIVVLVFTWLENILSTIEWLYDAKPIALLLNKE